MQTHPTRTAADLTIAGVVVLAAGALAREPAVLAWGGALVVGVLVARAATLVSIARIRAAGLEMRWLAGERVTRAFAGGEIELEAELANRDSRAARFVGLRAIAAEALDVVVEPERGEIPAAGALGVRVRVRTPRVGSHGLHSLALEVLGQPGMFEVPLNFPSPRGVLVLPSGFAAALASPRGGRGRRGSEGRPSRRLGEGSDLRELRELLPGDPWKRIAWKASARRGELLVRQMESDERDVVWIVLDASVELLAGRPGEAPLDRAIEHAASLAARHASAGDRIGLAIVAGRELAWVEPARGPAHELAVARELAGATSTLAADRSDLDESEIAHRVWEHLVSLDAGAVQEAAMTTGDALVSIAELARPRAPFEAPPALGRTPRDAKLREHLAAFGLGAPARLATDPAGAVAPLAATLAKVGDGRPRASLVYVLAPTPDRVEGALVEAARKLTRHGATLSWIATRHDEAEVASSGAVARTLRLRARLARERGERIVRAAGFRPLAPRRARKNDARALARREP